MKWYSSDPWKGRKRSRRRRKGARQLSEVPLWAGWGHKPMWLGALAVLLTVIGLGVAATPGRAGVVLQADLALVSGENPSAPGHAAEGRAMLTDDTPPLLSVDLTEMDPTRFPVGSVCQTEISVGAWTESAVAIQFDGATGTTFLEVETSDHVVVAGDRAEVSIRCESSGLGHETRWAAVFQALAADDSQLVPDDRQ